MIHQRVLGERAAAARGALRALIIDHRARVEPVNVHTGILHGPYRKCAVLDCPEPTLHLQGRWCPDHTFTRLPGPRWPANRQEA